MSGIRYLTSIYYTESGPFTVEQLIDRAKGRLFNNDHHILRLGESQWHSVRDLPETRDIMARHFPYQVGDTGPAGGFIIFDRQQRKSGAPIQGQCYTEAAPACIALAPWYDAVRLCAAYRGGGYGDWELASSGDLVELLRCRKHGDCINHSSPGWHWAAASDQERPGGFKDRAYALSFWGPSGPWGNTAGHSEAFDTGNAFAVRPVRYF
jgi:hypothetical protein